MPSAASPQLRAPAASPPPPPPLATPPGALLEYDPATEEALANAQPGDTIATTKEEEWVTRKKRDVTTTRQIATRVKREVVLEDGRLLSDSGPKISTSTHEDTHTANYHQSEHRALDPQSDDEGGVSPAALGVDQPDAATALGSSSATTPITQKGTAVGADGGVVVAPVSTVVTARVVANPDGKVRESHSRRELTHQVTDHVRETEEEFHMGDTTYEIEEHPADALLCAGTAVGADGGVVVAPVSTVVTARVVANPDGKVRESHSRRELTHQVTDHVRETKEEFHMGDTTYEIEEHPADALLCAGTVVGADGGVVVAPVSTVVTARVVANPDGKVRESHSRRELTHQVTDLVRETEEEFHMGDTTYEIEEHPADALLCAGTAVGADGGVVVAPVSTVVTARVVANPDGKVRESHSRRELTHQVTDHVRETEEEFHMGDTTYEIEEHPADALLCAGTAVGADGGVVVAPVSTVVTARVVANPDGKVRESHLRRELTHQVTDHVRETEEEFHMGDTTYEIEEHPADALLCAGTAVGADGGVVVAPVSTVVTARVVANPDGKVRESHSRRELTHQVTDLVRETEEEFHMGDTTHEAFIKAVNETEEEDIRDALTRRTSEQRALVAVGPRLVRETTAVSKTVDTEDTDELRALRPDGTIVTETKRTTEHELIKDEGLPDNEAPRSLASDESATRVRSGHERRARVDTERATDLMAGGRRLGGHVHSRTRTEEAEKEGEPNMEDPYDWDSLSMRMRRQRRLRHTEHDALKDSFAKRPIDFDIEEETRKKETSKWLENHFGSESRSSHDSIGEELARRPRPDYFDVATESKPAAAAAATLERDEGYYGKPTPPPPPFRADRDRDRPRPLRRTESSTPSDERDVVSKTGGYFKGVAEWSQRRATESRMPEPRGSSPSPPAARSPYASTDRLNGGAARKRDSPDDGRRARPPPSDSAYVSSSTVHSPPRGSPFRNGLERRREPSLEDEPRPVAPERRRPAKPPPPDERRYDSGYRSSSRNETSGASEPPPDYSPPPPRERERRASPERSPAARRRDERKQNQKTRFAAESARRRSPARKSVGTAIGDSIRKLVGKIRSASAERRARRRSAAEAAAASASRSPSPADLTSRTYRGYETDLAPPTPPAPPPQRYYLGEDPFAAAGSIYGREHKYEGASPRRAAAHDKRNGTTAHPTDTDTDHRPQYSSTLGRFSHSTGRLIPNGEREEEYGRSAQTLPRKLQVKREKESTSSSDKRWHQLGANKRSTSTVNVSVAAANGHQPGPAKPARTYRALNRSKSFAMGAPEGDARSPPAPAMSRNRSAVYKSNPHLSRLDETPERLKSPGIVSIINRSQRDLADAVSREAERRRDGLFGARYGAPGGGSAFANGHGRPDETDKKKLFMRGLKERAPELFHTLHGDESDGSRLSSRYGTPSPGAGAKERSRVSAEFGRESSPFVTRYRAEPRRGSSGSDNYSETYRYSSRGGDPARPSVTDTVETVSKRVVPTRDGRGKEIVESRETNSVTTSRYEPAPSALKYVENGRLNGFDSRLTPSPLYSERRNSNYKVTEKVREYRH